MISVYQRGTGGIWWARLNFGGRNDRFSLNTRDRREAEALALEIAHLEMTRGGDTPTTDECADDNGSRLDPGALAGLHETWKRWADVNLRPNSIERVRAAWKAFAAFHGQDMPTTATMEAFKEHLLASGKKAKTTNGYVIDVSSVFSRLIKLGAWHGSNPCAGVSKLKLAKRPPKFLTEAQAAALLEKAAAHSETMRLFCSLCLFAGLRKGEAVAARWEWIDFEGGTITVQAGHGFQPKSADCRTVPLADRLRAVLEPVRQASGYIIQPAKVQGKYRYRVDTKTSFARVIKAAGLPWVTPHVLRHTFASALVQKGVSIYKVQTWLGHQDPSTTQIYAHLQGADEDINR